MTSGILNAGAIGRLAAVSSVTGATDKIPVYQGGVLKYATPDQIALGQDAVVGPASATDNAIARFDGTTGELVQNSVVTIADTSGNMAGVGTLGVGAITTTGAFTLTGAVNTIFNSTSLDADFTIKKLTSGDAVSYNAGTALLTLGGNVTFEDGAFDVDLASHDGTNGLKLGGTLVTSSAAEINYNDITTLGTGAASKAVVLDAGEDYVWPAAGILTYGVLKDPAGSTLGATVAEINNACDVSTRLISIADATNTLALTAADHANRIVSVLDATLAITLPEATGTGNSYTILQAIAATSSTIVTADPANCGFHGFIMGSDTDAAGTYSWIATGAQDTITFNGTSTGGKLWDWIRVTDVGIDAWLLEGNIKQSGGAEATPLSSAA